MNIYKSLYFVFFVVLLEGCGSAPPRQPAPVQPASGTVKSIDARANDALPSARSERNKAEGVLQALLALGIDYRAGGKSRETGFDCSGLVANVYETAFNVRLPRLARAQAEYGIPIGLSQLESGDLLFYNTLGQPYSHVGIYIGDGRFVHAPKAGAQVRVEQLRASYWSQRFNGARRIPLI